MKMKWNIVVSVLGMVMMSLASASGSFAGSNDECVIPKLDGERVPFPLKNANTKFELAENETYLINGTIVQMDGKSYFKVDFESQPWLATQKRTQFPYFQINSSDLNVMKKFSGNMVQMAVVVRKKDVSSDGHEWDSSLVLEMIASPVILK